MSEYTIKTVSGSVVRFDDAGDGLPLTNCEVNIVPKVETGTVSGSVVAFSDGADDVPLKSCVITVPPTLDGVSSAEVIHTNYNMIDLANVSGSSGASITKTVQLNAGTYYIYSFCELQTFNRAFAYKPTDLSGSWITMTTTGDEYGKLERSSGNYNRGKNIIYVYKPIVFRYGLIINSNVAGKRIDCLLTTDSNGYSSLSESDITIGGQFYKDHYVTYRGESYNIDFSRTIYGGSVDALNGTGAAYGYVSGTWGTMTVSSLTPPTGYIIKSFNITSAVADYSKRSQSLGNIPLNNVITDASAHYAFQSQGKYIYVCMPENATSETEIKIAYPLETPEYFTFTPTSITSWLGDNTMWSDGDLSVEYYKKGYNTKTVNVVQTGKNLLPFVVDYQNFTKTTNGLTLTILDDGKIKLDGTTTASTDFRFYNATTVSEPHLQYPNGTYTFSNIGSASIKMIFSGAGNNGFPYSEIANNSYTGTITDGTKPFNYIVFRIASGVTFDNVIISVMLEYGSIATTYEPYVTSTTNTVNLGRSIHGGTVDVVKGTGISKYAMAAFPDCSWTCITSYQSNFNATNGIISVRFGKTAMGNAGYALTTEGVVCNNFANNNRSVWNNVNRLNEIGYSDGIVINMHYSDIGLEAWTDNSSTTLAAWKSSELYLSGIFALIKATPEPFTFTPIHLTSHSSNTLWSTEGDITVSYYSYIETDGRYLIYGDTLTDIANAIREKTSIVGPINVNDFVTDIMTIDDSAPDAEEVEF